MASFEDATNFVSVPSSGDYQFLQFSGRKTAPSGAVSVPSSGDYQFLLDAVKTLIPDMWFPSPHPGIINFFSPSPLYLFYQD